MNERKRPNHMIDSLFPVVLFFLFTICALVVLLLAVRVYESTTDNSARNNVSQATLIYITEKMHQNDCGTDITITEIEGHTALQLSHAGNKEGYVTYMYHYNNSLYELFIRSDISPSLSAGSPIAQIADFSVELSAENLLRLYVTDDKGNSFSALVGIHSVTER